MGERDLGVEGAGEGGSIRTGRGGALGNMLVI